MKPLSDDSQEQSTIDYYNTNAKAFIERTVAIELTEIYSKFLEHIPAGESVGRILDAGCGSGRDTKYFLEQGYEVVAFDASHEVAKFATTFTGQEVLQMKFEEIEFEDEFDAVWACASLLHVPRTSIDAVLTKFASALHVGGILYVSLKIGDGDEIIDGRHFTFFTEDQLADMFAKHLQFELAEIWTTSDRQVAHGEFEWLHGIAKRV
jgi:SAM-dependent methyltransferase